MDTHRTPTGAAVPQEMRCGEAIDLALRGNWDAAHKIVQDLDGQIPAWIHAVLHRIEGDLGNSQYWYRRAHRPFTEEEPRQELARIRETLRPRTPNA